MKQMANTKENLFVPIPLNFKDRTSVAKSTDTSCSDEKYDPNVYCRTCGNKDSLLVPIFKGEGLDYTLFEKIDKYLPIQVTEEDDLPLQLCYQCASALIAWDTLISGVLDAEKKLIALKNSVETKESEDLSDKMGDDVETLLSEDTDDEPLSFKKAPVKLKKNDEKRDILQEKNYLQTSLNPSGIETERLVEEPVLSFSTYQHQIKMRKPFIIKILNLTIDDMYCCNVCTTIGNLKFDYLKSESDLKSETCENVKGDNNACDDIAITESVLEKTKRGKKFKTKCRVVCENCGKILSCKLSLKNHMRTHCNEKSLTCHVCDKKFRHRFNLLRHLRVIHEGVREHVCADCGKRYRSRGEMEDHRNIHNIQEKIVCEECGRVFLTKASFYPHKKTHRAKTCRKDGQEFTCEKCHKVLTTKKSKSQHMLIHTGEKPLVCTVCGKKFRTKANFSQHAKVHSNVKPYACEHCGKAFARKDHLTIHIRSHTGEKPFVCSSCGRGFTQMNDMKKHSKIHEKGR